MNTISKSGLNYKEWLQPVLWIAIILLFAAVPFITSSGYYIHMCTMLGIMIIVTQGLNLLLGYSGLVSLGHAGFWAVGAYTYAIFTVINPVNPWLAILFTIIVSAIFGIILGFPALRMGGHYLAMLTIGFGIIIEKLLMELSPLTGGVMGINSIPAPTIFGYTFSATGMFYVTLVLVIACTLFIKNLAASRSGRAFMALRENEIAASTMGINIFRFKINAFVLSAVIAGLGGVLYSATVHYVSPDTFTYSFSVMFLAILIVGGMGTVIGPIIGAILIYVGPEQLQQFADYKNLLYGLALLICIVLIPNGLVPLIKSVFQKRPQKAEISDNYLGDGVHHKQISNEIKNKIDKHFRLIDEQIYDDNYILKIKGIYKHFDGVVAVDHINFNVERGTIHGLIGPNGSGKTTLLHTISKLYQKDDGQIIFQDEDISDIPSHLLVEKGICRTFQISQLFKKLTVIENVMIGQFHWRTANMAQGVLKTKLSLFEEKQSTELAYDLLCYFGLEQYKDTIAGELPYGSQRLLEIVRAVASKPKLLLLDEPAAGMNPSEAMDLLEQLERIKDLGISILLIEHNMDLIMQICDHITVLNSGAIIADGTPEVIQNNPEVVEAYLGSYKQ